MLIDVTISKLSALIEEDKEKNKKNLKQGPDLLLWILNSNQSVGGKTQNQREKVELGKFSKNHEIQDKEKDGTPQWSHQFVVK